MRRLVRLLDGIEHCSNGSTGVTSSLLSLLQSVSECNRNERNTHCTVKLIAPALLNDKWAMRLSCVWNVTALPCYSTAAINMHTVEQQTAIFMLLWSSIYVAYTDYTKMHAC
jgi:hypothetical protein